MFSKGGDSPEPMPAGLFARGGRMQTLRGRETEPANRRSGRFSSKRQLPAKGVRRKPSTRLSENQCFQTLQNGARLAGKQRRRRFRDIVVVLYAAQIELALRSTSSRTTAARIGRSVRFDRRTGAIRS